MGSKGDRAVLVVPFSEMMSAFQEAAIQPVTHGRRTRKQFMGSDENAFNQLLARYQGKVLRLCYAMLGNRALAEETAQDVFIKIWRGLGTFRRESSQYTWIYAITRNACLDARERVGARKTDSLDDPEVLRRAHGHQLAHSQREPQTDVRRWVAELPEPQRQALTLFYLEEKSYEEVAGALAVPLGTIKTWIHRGRRALVERQLQSEAASKLRSWGR
jgi:RNA polymerase sigma-70 factor, ECF subfamily